jgi:hypothetical protein
MNNDDDVAGSMTSTEGGRKMDFNKEQLGNAPDEKYQHSDGNSNVTERRYLQPSKAELWICVTDAGIVIAERQ